MKTDNVVHALEADGRGLVHVIKLSFLSFEKAVYYFMIRKMKIDFVKIDLQVVLRGHRTHCRFSLGLISESPN